MTHITEKEIAYAFDLIVDAAKKGARCPHNQPFGPLRAAVLAEMIKRRQVRSEVSGTNFRRVVILTGPYAGLATAAPPGGAAPYRVNGVMVKRLKPEVQAAMMR